MPGDHDQVVPPVPEDEALAFLLSHAFPGHRRMVRSLSERERKRVRLAMWADSVSERMSHVDRVWRAITEQTMPPADPTTPQLIQIVHFGPWAYPLYLDGACTRVIPHGGMPLAEVEPGMAIHLDRMAG